MTTELLLPSERLAERLAQAGVHSMPDMTGETLCIIPLVALEQANLSKGDLHRLLAECAVRDVTAQTDDLHSCIRVGM